MSIAIIGMGTAKGKNLDLFRARPEFRKATLNMVMAAASQEEALSLLPSIVSEENLSSSALIVGSSHGELETTVSFLDYLAQTGVARPLLFQNSLHNSTLGFLAMRLHLTGPALTVSNRFFTGEDCLDLALTLLRERDRPFCIVTVVDSVVPQLRIDGEDSVGSATEGAATLILTRRDTAEKKSWPILGFLNRIEYHKDTKANSPDPLAEKRSYDSDSIEKVIEHLRLTGSVPGANPPKSQGLGHPWLENRLDLYKPDGNKTVIHLESF